MWFKEIKIIQNKQTYILWNSNWYQTQVQDMLNNHFQYHNEGWFDIHCENHNFLHLHHKDYQLYKNVHLQELVYNNNQLQRQIQVKLDNWLIHKQDHLDIHHEHHNLLHFQNKCYNCRIHHLHCIEWHS